MIIYPPLIGDRVPAFTYDQIKIPFSHNPAVDWQEVKGFRLLIKNYNDLQIQAELYVSKENIDLDGNIIFNLIDTEWFPTKYQYYKFQICYDDDTDNRYWSSVSIGRCIGDTIQPRIEGLELNEINKDLQTYTVNTLNYAERLYSYRFEFFKPGYIVIQDTQDMLAKEAGILSFKLQYDLQADIEYILRFSFVTINGYTNFVEYKIIKNSQLIECPLKITASQNQINNQKGMPAGSKENSKKTNDKKAYNNAYIILSLSKILDNDITGSYIIERKIKTEEKWTELFQFKVLTNTKVEELLWKDCTLEQGVIYQYSIKKINGNSYSKKRYSDDISIDFEDIFLSDNMRQLKIKFNPKVSSFKTTILEQKTDTIGGKFPFYFRNGNVNYKEVPISGLISYLMDEDQMFMNNIELGLSDTDIRTTNLDSYNITIERKFKQAVMEWLTDGKPKLFRSPTEGIYMLRIMNVSLSPQDTLGRMLHSFSATGYEIAESDIENLINTGFFNNTLSSKPLSALGYFILNYSALEG